MKILIALLLVFSMNIARAEQGSLTSSFLPEQSENKNYSSIGLYLRNRCYEDVYVITRTRDYYGGWQTRGYYRIYPGQTIYNTTMDLNYFYLHATTYDGSIRWEGPYNIELNGRYHRARLVQLPGNASGDWTISLICN